MKLNLQKMSREEKLQVMHALWEDLSRNDDQVESLSWHAGAFKDTESRVEAGSEGIRDWEEAKAELQKRAQ